MVAIAVIKHTLYKFFVAFLPGAVFELRSRVQAATQLPLLSNDIPDHGNEPSDPFGQNSPAVVNAKAKAVSKAARLPRRSLTNLFNRQAFHATPLNDLKRLAATCFPVPRNTFAHSIYHQIAKTPKAADIQEEATVVASDPNSIPTCLSGAVFFGFGLPPVMRVLEGMSGVAACQITPQDSRWPRYQFKYSMPQFEDITSARGLRESLRAVGLSSEGGCARVTLWGAGKSTQKNSVRCAAFHCFVCAIFSLLPSLLFH